jgi:hypothetical protein
MESWIRGNSRELSMPGSGLECEGILALAVLESNERADMMIELS